MPEMGEQLKTTGVTLGTGAGPSNPARQVEPGAVGSRRDRFRTGTAPPQGLLTGELGHSGVSLWAHTEPGGLLGLCSAQGSLNLKAVTCSGGQAHFRVGGFGRGWTGDAEQGRALQLVLGAGPGAWCCLCSLLCACARGGSWQGTFSGMKTGEMLQARHWHKHLTGQLTAASSTGDTAFRVFARNCPLLPRTQALGDPKLARDPSTCFTQCLVAGACLQQNNPLLQRQQLSSPCPARGQLKAAVRPRVMARGKRKGSEISSQASAPGRSAETHTPWDGWIQTSKCHVPWDKTARGEVTLP